MDYKAVHTQLGLDLPSEIFQFEELHAKLYAIGKATIYDFLSLDSRAIPAATLAFKAKPMANRSTSESEKEIALEVFNLFSDSKKDEKKAEYDYFLAFLAVNKIFDELLERVKNEGSAPLHQNVCRHFIGKLTDGLSGYPNKPESRDVFIRFCDINNISYAAEIKEETSTAQSKTMDKPPSDSGMLINLKAVIKDMNSSTADIANALSACEQSYQNAFNQHDTLKNGYLELENKKPVIDKYLSECLSFSNRLSTATQGQDENISSGSSVEGQDETKKESILSKASGFFAKITRPLGKGIDRHIEKIETEPFKYLPEIRSGIQSVDDIKASLQNLVQSFDELVGGRTIIFDESDVNISNAERKLSHVRGLSQKATQMCENANAQNKVSNLIDVDAEQTLLKINELSAEVNEYKQEFDGEITSIVAVTGKYNSIVSNIRQSVDVVRKKNAETYSNSAAKVNAEVSKFKMYNYIGWGAFIISLLFSVPNIIKIITSLFTLNFTWQNGKGTFGFMLVFILLVPVVFMFVRSYWIKFLNQTIRTINQISLGFESRISDYEQFHDNILRWKSSFVSSSKIFELLIVINYMLCSVSFVVYVLMAIIASFVK